MAFGSSNSRVASYRSVPGSWTTGGSFTAASLTTALTGSNNDLTYVADSKGAAGNAIRVEYLVAGNSTALTARWDNTTKVVTVNVATDSGGVARSTAADIRTAVNASAAPVTAGNAAGNDGTGVVTALAARTLTSGSNWVIGTRR